MAPRENPPQVYDPERIARIAAWHKSRKIGTKEKRAITKDWLSFFPGFKEYEPMWLIRRNGPFVCGIHLQRPRSNEDYHPLFHIHDLMVDFPVISSGAPTPLLNKKGARDSLTLLRHKEHFDECAERLKQQIPLLQKNTLDAGMLVSYIKTAIDLYSPYSPEALQSAVLAFFWCGNMEEAEKEIANGKQTISHWQEDVKQRVGGENGWERQVRSLMNKEALKATVETQIQKFKLEKFTDFQLIEQAHEPLAGPQ